MNEFNKLGASLEASTATDNLKELISELADKAITLFNVTGEDIPLISYLFKGIKATNAIRNALFMEKVINFLTSIDKAPFKHRAQMIENINQDENYRVKFGKFSISALEQFEDAKKAEYLGRAAKYLANGNITYEFYQRFSFILGRLYLADLERLPTLQFLSYYNPVVSDFESLGLVKTILSLPNTTHLERNGVSSSRDRQIKVSSRNLTVWGEVVKNILLDLPLNHGMRGSLEDISQRLKTSN